jgi:hypothetical protein
MDGGKAMSQRIDRRDAWIKPTLVALLVLTALVVTVIGSATLWVPQEDRSPWGEFLLQELSDRFAAAAPARRRSFDIDLKVPAGSEPTRTVRITVTDARGVREVFHARRQAGQKLKVPLVAQGRTGRVIVRVYVDRALLIRSAL